MVRSISKIAILMFLLAVVGVSHAVVFAETGVSSLGKVISVSDSNHESEVNDQDSKFSLVSEQINDLVCKLVFQNQSIQYIYSSYVRRNLAIRSPPIY